MDLMRILRSLEEFLYELVGWLVFYPRTLWRVLRHPAVMARYVEGELGKPEEQRFADTISPVLMLILSVVIAHGIELVTRSHLAWGSGALAGMLFGTEQGLLLMRCIVFCTFAFTAALSTLRQRGQPVTRDTLRVPFSIQALLVSPFVVGASLAMAVGRTAPAWAEAGGGILFLATLAWYLGARVQVYRAFAVAGWFKAVGYVVGMFSLTAAALLAVLAVLLSG
ncbi:hypothetical protein KQ945_03640 [Bacillus subtilis subsp. subtilis]|nr:hypothetical protein [Bacillus subtilis subsp. subtilis]